MRDRMFPAATVIVGALFCGSCCFSGRVCVNVDRACLPAGTAVCLPPVTSWNSSLGWAPRIVTVSDIHKNFAKLGQKDDSNTCCTDVWKRALPEKWKEHEEHFVQVNRLRVLSADVDATADICMQGGKQFGDAHVKVESIDDPTAGTVTVEFDRCWAANGLCDDASALPKEGDVIDVQGFVTWDPCSNDSCWEIHPVSGWRLSIDYQKPGKCGPR